MNYYCNKTCCENCLKKMIKSEVGSVLKIRAFASNSWYQYNRTHMLRSEEGSVNKFGAMCKKIG